VKRTSYETPHYAVFSSLLIQIIFLSTLFFL